MNHLEEQLCSVYGKKYGVYTGNGTTAMYLAFEALGLHDRKAVFPAISCTNPVNSALFAGYEVDFCDVRMEDFTMNPIYLETMLRTGEYGIVVPTHIYGNICDMGKICEICQRYGAVVLEDAAQAEHLYGGDISITSFGHTKIFETDAGGGIAFTDDEALYQKMTEFKKLLPDEPSDSGRLFDIYREKYYSIVRNSRSEEEKNLGLRQLQMDSRDIFIYDSHNNSEILDMLGHRSEILEARITRQKLYNDGLNSRYITIPDCNSDLEHVMWRYTFLYNGDRDAMVAAVRSHGIDISTWYPSLAGIYRNEHLANADTISSRVVNLWVTDDHTEEQIVREIKVINECMEAAYNGR